MLLLDSYPDPVFPPDVELGVFRLGEQLFHGGAGVVGGFGGEPEVGATVVVAVRSKLDCQDHSLCGRSSEMHESNKKTFAADAQGGVIWQQGRRDEYVVEESDRDLTSGPLSVCESWLNRWVSSWQSIDSLTIPSGLCDLTLPTRASPMYGRKTINRNSAGVEVSVRNSRNGKASSRKMKGDPLL